MPAIRRVLSALLLVTPFAATALGLGDIEVASGLNQPFDAKIPVIGAKPGEIVDLSADLAEQETFERAGLARPYSLNRLKFSVVAGEGDSGYVHVTSREAVREPALEFIIEVKWRNGSMQRKYSVLLERK